MPESDDSLALDDTHWQAQERGSEPALIEQFGIRGLYGYRDISLSSKFAATILIARNGTGKTTLLGALDSFLKLQLYRLRELEFSEIFCKIRGIDEAFVVNHDDIVLFLQPPMEGEFAKLVSRAGVDQQKLFKFLQSDYKSALRNWYNDYDSNSVVNTLVRGFSSDVGATIRACSEVYDTLFRRSQNLARLRSGLAEAIQNYEVVYLPTYRRVELALTDEGEDHRRRRGRPRPKLSFSSSGLHTAEIQFGLGDISERLSDLNNEIITRSNQGYRELSENIINELINGYEVSGHMEPPRPDDLKLFFSRLEIRNRMMGPQYPISAPDFERIYSGEGVPSESRKFLTYFLGKLNRIINITKDIEKPVGDFINKCNKYLSSIEPSIDENLYPEHKRLNGIDAKALEVNRTDLSVHLRSVPARTPVPLDALSSGEKQMVSLFAKMYLYPKRKIVLIDEPELSLSIDWQRGILVDVLLSPNCEQVIAITHSPFVFDNALEPFARTLDLAIRDRTEPEFDLEPFEDGEYAEDSDD